MSRKLIFALCVLVLAGLLVSCNGTVPPVTVEPTVVIPTEVRPTAVPSPIPTAKPTAVPTEVPTPTEVPLYVGLSTDEVEVLREQCLQENPNSLCLPLPMDPTLPGMVLSEDEGSISMYSVGSVSEILAPIPGAIDVMRNGDAPGVLLPDRTGSLQLRIDYPQLEMVIVRRNLEGVWGLFADAEIESLISSGQNVSTGDLLVVIKGPYLMWIDGNSMIGHSIGALDHLLRDEFGSIVYIRP